MQLSKAASHILDHLITIEKKSEILFTIQYVHTFGEM